MGLWLQRVAGDIALTYQGSVNALRDYWQRLRSRTHDRELRRVYRRLNPRGRARLDAVLSQNHVEEGRLTSQERLAKTEYQTVLDGRKIRTTRRIEELSMRMRRIPPLPTLNEKPILEGVARQEAATLDLMTPELVEARSRRILTNAIKRSFARANRLIREPLEPHPIIAPIVLFFLWAIEMFVNANYLLVSGGGTIAQNIMLVAVTAAFNIGLAIPAGAIGFKNIGHVQPMRRVFGWCVVALCFTLCVALHFLLAHYRLALDQAQLIGHGKAVDYELLEQRIDDAFIHLGSSIGSQPFAVFGDLYAVMVFVGGLAFAAASAADAYLLMGDRYPGYSAVAEEYARAAAADNAVRDQFRARIYSITDAARRFIDMTIADAAARRHEATDILNAAIAETREYQYRADAVDMGYQNEEGVYDEEIGLVAPKLRAERIERGCEPLDREINVDLDHYATNEETLTAIFLALVDEGQRIKIVLTTTEMSLRARVDEVLAQVQVDAASQATAEAKLREIAGLGDG
jgi:hypothetical protein